MDFIKPTAQWLKGELLQGKVMIVIGVAILIACILILKSHNTLLRGMLVPMSLLLTVLIGYGGYVLYSRPTHNQNVIEMYNRNANEALQFEIAKQTKDYNSCKTLTRIYPILMLLGVLALIFIPSHYYKGMAIGFVIMFIAAYLMDSSFMQRSSQYLEYLKAH